MIKKSVFENDLISGMQRELRKQASDESPSLVKAGECLHAALEILEEAGLQSKANRILEVLRKIAANPTKVVRKMPTIEKLKHYGLTDQDLKLFGEGHAGAKARMNLALRRIGLDDQEIANFIGKHNVIPESDLKAYEKFTSWIDDPLQPEESLHPGQIVDVKSLPQLPEDIEDLPPGKELSFQSIANKHHKPGRPDKRKDPSTKKLTPEKMIANLKHHGTEFNMPDLSWANFDAELADALGANTADELDIDDIMDADIIDDVLEVFDQKPLDDFEDEVSSPK